MQHTFLHFIKSKYIFSNAYSVNKTYILLIFSIN